MTTTEHGGPPAGGRAPGDDPRELRELYADFGAEHLVPLWTQRDDLMPCEPSPAALPHVWRWSALYPLAQRAGDLVPVGRGGERAAARERSRQKPRPLATKRTQLVFVQHLGDNYAS